MSATPNKGRICLECEHCNLFGGMRGYSDCTPPEPFEFECEKKHPFVFAFGNCQDKGDLLKDLSQAVTCPDFKLEVKP